MDLQLLQKTGQCSRQDISAGVHVLNAPLVSEQSVNFYLRGAGRGSTRIIWAGPCDVYPLQFIGADSWLLEDLTLEMADDACAPAFIQFANGSSGINSTQGGLCRVNFVGGNRVQHLVHGLNSATKNDSMTFREVRGGGYTESAFRLEGRNAKAYSFLDCRLYGKGVGKAAVDTSAVPGSGASFRFVGGEVTGHTDADFVIGDRNDTLHIGHVYSEDSHRFLRALDTGPGTSSGRPLPTVIDSVRFASGPSMAADGEVIQYEACGPLTILGGSFGNESPGAQVRVRFSPKPAPGAFTATGAFFANDGDGVVFNGQKPTNDYAQQNLAYRASKRIALGAA
jgi:hypothetical protein